MVLGNDVRRPECVRGRLEHGLSRHRNFETRPKEVVTHLPACEQMFVEMLTRSYEPLKCEAKKITLNYTSFDLNNYPMSVVRTKDLSNIYSSFLKIFFNVIRIANMYNKSSRNEMRCLKFLDCVKEI